MAEKIILVTGAAGYIGSHACVELLNAGYRVIALDNLANSSHAALARVEQLCSRPLPFHRADVREGAALDALFARYPIDAVLHFAGVKAVGESVANPLRYFDNNVGGSLCLLERAQAAGVRRFLFSSSATVYGDPDHVPIVESAPTRVSNPYGRSKLMVEQMLEDLTRSDPDWVIGVLRYFNPAGAHPSGLIGEDPRGVPNNLMPFIAQVASGQREQLAVFGGDYPTPDGTGVRDYIHVVDLALGHVKALDRMFDTGRSFTVNLGSGQGYSVLEMVRAFEAASGRRIRYEIVARRPGDIGVCYADPSQAQALLDWRAQKKLADMCVDHWRWQSLNPHGFSATVGITK